MKKKVLFIIKLALLVIAIWYFCRFYPQQMMPVGKAVTVLTPSPEKYHNDCLHPCIRMLDSSTYVMVQSPYYGWNNQIENPMLYKSHNLMKWECATLLAETPESGYNSDPNVFVEDSSVYVFWRENDSPLCSEMGGKTLLGGLVGGNNEVRHLNRYMVNTRQGRGDNGLCPILIKHNGEYLFYTVWSHNRKNKGIVIWKGNSLDEPDFVLSDTLPFDNPLVCDKWVQKKLFGHIWFVPKPKRYDLWHFDLFEYGTKLYMVSCAEKDDNIMLSESSDWKHFKTRKKPLINNHYSEKHTGHRQYYYKPTAIVQNDSLYLFYTANSQDDNDRNQLYLSVMSLYDLGI